MNMPNFTISAKAYAKIVLHCCKYPHRAVNGVVIGTFSDKDQGAGVLIQDAVPLFHQNLSLAAMLEVALRQVHTPSLPTLNLELLLGFVSSISAYFN